MLFYTFFIITEYFHIFREKGQNTIKMRKCYLFLVKYVCRLTGCSGKCNKTAVGTVVYTNLHVICVFCISPVLCEVVPQPYMQVVEHV